MSIKKKYLKKNKVCKVTFVVPKKEANGAKSVRVVGDFNNWDLNSTPMKSLKSGAFEASIELEPNKEYQFRYLLDESIWENDSNADKYEPNPYNCQNSVVII